MSVCYEALLDSHVWRLTDSLSGSVHSVRERVSEVVPDEIHRP
jgi:hypothetical protein